MAGVSGRRWLAGHRRGIVCACDVENLDVLEWLLPQIDPVAGLVGYKLGSLLTLRHGLPVVTRVFRRLTDKPLLYDHQKAGLDIPSMADQFVPACRDAGVDALVLFPLAGPRAVDAFVSATLKAGLLPVVGGALPLPDYLTTGGGYVAADGLARIAERAFALGARDFIVPATDSAAIRHHARVFAGNDTRLFLPGIGPLGGEIELAFAAAAGCASVAIIGRAIYADPDPAQAACRLAGRALAVRDNAEGRPETPSGSTDTKSGAPR
jgi:orotidine-5'-phosphate decarboxylase